MPWAAVRRGDGHGARSAAIAVLLGFAAAATWRGGFGATPALIASLYSTSPSREEALSPAAALQRLGQCKSFACLRREREKVTTRFSFPHFMLVRALSSLGRSAGPARAGEARLPAAAEAARACRAGGLCQVRHDQPGGVLPQAPGHSLPPCQQQPLADQARLKSARSRGAALGVGAASTAASTPALAYSFRA